MSNDKPQGLKGWTVQQVSRSQIKDFIEEWHYSKSINGCIADYCYALYDSHMEMKGAMFYGRMAMANQWKRFSNNANDVIELRRLACVDDTPKNAESFFIGKTLRLLRKASAAKIVVSYADKEHGHAGTIYKASNFTKVDDIPGAKVIMYQGKRYHDKTIRTKYNGVLKPFAKKIAEALQTGDATYKATKGKHTYVFFLSKDRPSTHNKGIFI